MEAHDLSSNSLAEISRRKIAEELISFHRFKNFTGCQKSLSYLLGSMPLQVKPPKPRKITQQMWKYPPNPSFVEPSHDTGIYL